MPQCAGPGDVPGFDPERELGRPGEYPFTRGPYPAMYTARHWTMRQYAGYGTAAETNRRFRYLLAGGQTGLSLAFDLPTQMGYDSDHPMARGEVGRMGVAIDTVDDMAAVFDGIDQGAASASMTINAPAAVLLAMYVTVAEERGVPRRVLAGTIQNDILKEYVARGTYIFPPSAGMRLVVDVMRFCAREMPRFHPISVSGYHLREAGATAVQEVAFTLADAIAYVEAARAAGLDGDRIGRQLSFFFSAHNDLFEEVAKFRAARRLWAEIMRERFGARDPDAWRLRFHTQTAGCTLTAQQPLVNAIRVAYQALAAVLGGTQSLHTNAFDEALGLPTEGSAMLALRTQQVLAHETGVVDSVDPLAGSYLVERLTRDVVEQARELIERIDAMGGAMAAIENGFFTRQIEESAYTDQREVEDGTRTVVGVNRFTEEGAGTLDHLEQDALGRGGSFTVDPQVEASQVERLRHARASRDGALVRCALDEVAGAARDPSADLMEPILVAVRARATLGEITEALEGVFGRYRP